MKLGRATVLAAASIVWAGSTASYGTLIGQSITTTSQVNAGPIQQRSDTVVDPGAEINFGDANAFSWMVPGDSIDFSPYGNVNAPWALNIALGATHNFAPSDTLTLTFELPSPLTYGVAAITQAITVNQIAGSLNGNLLTLTINDMTEVSQGDFGGNVRVIFSTVPEPTTALLLLPAALMLRRKTRG